MNTFLWVVFPYLSIVVLAGGTVWRYRYDKFGWTTRSSQLYETNYLRWGSPLFHFGVLFVLIGHIVGLLIPKSWTEAVGITEHLYHLMAVFIGTVAGLCTLIGMAILILRRRLTGPVFAATTRNDKTMYVVLGSVILLGLWATVKANITGGGYDYRETVSPWLRSLFTLQPDVALMTAVPAGFKIHIIAAFVLFACWPFTRLVHAFSAPVGYLTRPYVVYRYRDPHGGLRPTRPGWEPPR
ncbi:nitrate reductase gamma subunit [Actinoplanes campanulatus]|uniref:Nitrate reductase-like protein NarX n=1 Tax=Actinoplanes campanulatus TaxID=113559 RepID=A0A7W5AG84_9ACTN|nr:respiratory nitrate reductase subunit gamma [Actinoplanes campanulatus]MBB3095490.1 nitrate reductase gamma subunit [Actinoplanes campanulatus]GGN09391.1 nitrate reductase subunit gamma [Actinoplanes campanulatus]GID36381.1 nitrate reductase subunit gamma [Actinoplanes campanulatus]